MRKSAEQDLRQQFEGQSVEHKGVKIRLDAGYKTRRPGFSVNNGEFTCDTLQEAIKKADYVALKNRKLPAPISAFKLSLNGPIYVDILEVHPDGCFVVRAMGEKAKDKKSSWKRKEYFENTEANGQKAGEIEGYFDQINELQAKIKVARSWLTRVPELVESDD